MPARNPDLHGNVPDKADVALLLIDVINDLGFKEGGALLKRAWPVAEKIARLKRRAKGAGIPVIYVNDNFGKWRPDFRKLVSHCLQDDVCGRPLVQKLEPASDDYFVLKPKNSAFCSTTSGPVSTIDPSPAGGVRIDYYIRIEPKTDSRFEKKEEVQLKLGQQLSEVAE